MLGFLNPPWEDEGRTDQGVEMDWVKLVGEDHEKDERERLDAARNAERSKERMARLVAKAPWFSGKPERYWRKKADAERTMSGIGGMGEDGFIQLERLVADSKKLSLTDRELCHVVDMVSQAPLDAVKMSLESWLHARADAREATRQKNGVKWEAVGQAITTPLMKIGSGGAVAFASSEAAKLLNAPAVAWGGIATVCLHQLFALIGFARQPAGALSSFLDARARYRTGPDFLVDVKFEWPLPPGESILGLSEKEAEAKRAITKKDAVRLWKSMPPTLRQEMTGIDGDSFLTWREMESEKERARFLADWRARLTTEPAARLAVALDRPIRVVKVAAIGLDTARAWTVPGSTPALGAWRDERNQERRSAKAYPALLAGKARRP